jgi:sulfate permease, SulP family
VTDASPHSLNLKGEAAGGVMAGLFLLPNLLAVGMVATAPLGPTWLAAGIKGAFAATIIAALLRALLGGAFHINAPRPSQAAMLAALMVQLTALTPMPAGNMPAEMLLAASFLALAVAGLLQCGLGAVRVGGFLRLIPLPVAAGFANGFAVAIAAAQFPAFLGLRNWDAVNAAVADPARLSPWPVLCGAAALVASLAAPRLIARIPAGFVGLGAGCLLHAGSAFFLPAGAALSPVVGAFADGLPFVWSGEAMWGLLTGGQTAIFWPILETAATLAAIASLQSLVSLSTSDALTGRQSDGDGELLRQGAAAMAGALVGGTAVGGSPLYTRVAWINGGRGRGAQIFLAAALLAAVTLLADGVAALPLAVLAGVVIATMIGTLDPWSLRAVKSLRNPAAPRAAVAIDLSISLAVAGAVIFAGALPALATGLGLAAARRLWPGKAV